MNFPSRSTSFTTMRPLADACWLMWDFTTVPPTMLAATLSLRRRFLVLLAPEEVRLLDATAEECSRRLAWDEPVERVTMTLAEGGLGDRRSLVGGRSMSTVCYERVPHTKGSFSQMFHTNICHILNFQLKYFTVFLSKASALTERFL